MLEWGLLKIAYFYCLNYFHYLNYFQTGRKNPRKDHNASFLIEVESRSLQPYLKKQIPP